MTMDWLIAAPFSTETTDRWLAAYVPPSDRRFESVVAGYDHDRSRKATTRSEWGDYFRHAGRAWRAARSAPRRTGLITCFPQLPLAIGLYNMAPVRSVPTVAWTFNVGNLAGGLKRRVAMAAFRHVDVFTVHARAEVAACSEWLDLPPERFRFVALQRGLRDRELEVDEAQPFVVSMGTAQRDYRMLMAVLGELGYPAVVVCGSHALKDVHVPPNVEVRSGLSIEQCHELLQRARLNVVPVANVTTASGQIALLDAMMLGCPTVATDCPGTVDYGDHEHNVLLVRPGGHAEMKTAIQRLWDDASLRRQLAARARHRIETECSDEAVGLVMGRLLEEVEQQYAST